MRWLSTRQNGGDGPHTVDTRATSGNDLKEHYMHTRCTPYNLHAACSRPAAHWSIGPSALEYSGPRGATKHMMKRRRLALSPKGLKPAIVLPPSHPTLRARDVQ